VLDFVVVDCAENCANFSPTFPQHFLDQALRANGFLGGAHDTDGDEDENDYDDGEFDSYDDEEFDEGDDEN
jgi:hypothetical protein